MAEIWFRNWNASIYALGLGHTKTMLLVTRLRDEVHIWESISEIKTIRNIEIFENTNIRYTTAAMEEPLIYIFHGKTTGMVFEDNQQLIEIVNVILRKIN